MSIGSRIRKTFPAAALLCAMPLGASRPTLSFSASRPGLAAEATPQSLAVDMHPLATMAREQIRAIIESLKQQNIEIDPEAYGQIMLDINAYATAERMGDAAKPGMLNACLTNRPFPVINVVASSNGETYYFEIAKMDGGKLVLRMTGESSQAYVPVAGYDGMSQSDLCNLAVEGTLYAVGRSKASNIPKRFFMPGTTP